MLTTTLNQIKSFSPCKSGWEKVLKANGGTEADRDLEFPVSSILDSNDLDDTLWVVAHLDVKICVDFSKWCALQNIDKIEPYCSEEEYQLILDFLGGDVDLQAARSAAESARSAAESARSAVWSAWSAESAARSAVESAARSAESAARSAAESAARSAESAARSAHLAARSAAWSVESVAESAAQINKLLEVLNNVK